MNTNSHESEAGDFLFVFIRVYSWLKTTVLQFRKQNRQRGFRRKHTAGVVAAERNHGHRVAGAELLVHVLAESLAAGEARGALGHRRAGAVETAERQNVDFAQQIGGGAGGELLLQLVIALLEGVSADPALQAVGPPVVGGAVVAVVEGAKIGSVGSGPGGVQVGVAGRVGDHVGDGDIQGVVDLVGHLVAVDKLAAGGVAGDDDRFQIRKDLFARQLAQDPVGEIVGSELVVGCGGSAGAPAIAIAAPAHLVGRQRIAAPRGIGGEARGDDDGVVQGARQERGGDGGAEIVVGIAAGPVDHHQGAGDLGVGRVHGVSAVD